MSDKEKSVVDLLPCPFCAAEIRIRGGFNSYGHCPTDGCHANRAQIVPLDDERQVSAWNRRAAPAPSSLAGGEDVQKRVERIVFEDFYGAPVAGSKERLAKALILEFGLAALSPEAPARDWSDMLKNASDQIISDALENGSLYVDLDNECIAWNGPGFAETVVGSLKDCGFHVVPSHHYGVIPPALAPRHEAPASEGDAS